MTSTTRRAFQWTEGTEGARPGATEYCVVGGARCTNGEVPSGGAGRSVQAVATLRNEKNIIGVCQKEPPGAANLIATDIIRHAQSRNNPWEIA